MQVPILILSDAPDQMTGLARIARDLATLLASTPEFRVATLGYAGHGASKFPWQQYQMYSNELGELSLPYAWDDFAQGEPGIVFTIWDLSRLLWLARPEYAEDEQLATWIRDSRRRKFKLWSYLPIDATGPGNKLTAMAKEALLGIDRVLAYTPWARDVVVNTISKEEAEKRGVDWLPHGLNLRTFTTMPVIREVSSVNTCDASDKGETVAGVEEQPSKVEEHDQSGAGPAGGLRGGPSVRDDAGHGGDGSVGCVARVGVVMTNQPRKDWGLCAAVCSAMLARRKDLRFWWHADTVQRAWDLRALVADYGLTDAIEITTPPMADGELADRYRACAVTILPSLGEGFGYPAFESFACGVPCVHGDYAGAASLMREFGLGEFLVEPVQWRIEGQHDCVRPVFDPADWVRAVECTLDSPPDARVLAAEVEHLGWKQLGKTWQKWFVEGLGQ